MGKQRQFEVSLDGFHSGCIDPVSAVITSYSVV